MLSLIGTILGLIPGLEGLASTFLTKAFDAKVKMVQARTQADRDVAVELVRKAATDSHESVERLKAVAGSAALLVLVFMFAIPLAAFEWKVIVWDKLLARGSTDPLTGAVADWAGVIIGSLFGSTSALTLGGMWFNRKIQ
jgi:hypothetical protein